MIMSQLGDTLSVALFVMNFISNLLSNFIFNLIILAFAAFLTVNSWPR